jgi:hypothetical protein
MNIWWKRKFQQHKTLLSHFNPPKIRINSLKIQRTKSEFQLFVINIKKKGVVDPELL